MSQNYNVFTILNSLSETMLKMNENMLKMNERLNTIESNQIKLSEKIDILRHDIKEAQNHVVDCIIHLDRKIINIPGVDEYYLRLTK